LTFDAAAALVDALGVSDAYTSPFLDALTASLGGEHADVVALKSLITWFATLPPHAEKGPEGVAARRRDKEVGREKLVALLEASPAVRAFVGENIWLFNGKPGDAQSMDLLDALLTEQAYRAACWRVAGEEINYRRFFDINELAAIRMEEPEVFEATHRLLFRLVREGAVTGRRIMETSMASELNMLAHRLNAISEKHRTSRDFTLGALTRALREVIAAFPVYRTYVTAAQSPPDRRAPEAAEGAPTANTGVITDRDREYVRRAVAHARRQVASADAASLRLRARRRGRRRPHRGAAPPRAPRL